MSVWLIAFEKIDFKQIAQTNLSRPLIRRCRTCLYIAYLNFIDLRQETTSQMTFKVDVKFAGGRNWKHTGMVSFFWNHAGIFSKYSVKSKFMKTYRHVFRKRKPYRYGLEFPKHTEKHVHMTSLAPHAISNAMLLGDSAEIIYRWVQYSLYDRSISESSYVYHICIDL